MLKTKNLFNRCFLLATFLVLYPALSLPLNAANQNRQIRVGWFESIFNHKDDYGRRSGYSYDYQIRIAANTGWDYDYVEGAWDELYEKLLRGEIDLLSRVSKTEKTIDKLLISDLPIGMENLYVIALASDTSIVSGNFSTLDGKSIGVPRESVQLYELQDWKKNNKVNCTICEFNIAEDNLTSLLDSGKVDAVATFPSFCNVDRNKYQPVAHIRTVGMYFAVNRNKPELKAELDRAMSKIVSHNVYFNKSLHEKYLKSDELFNTLPRSEADWLKQHGTIRIGYRDNYLPYCGTDPKTEKTTGLIKDFIDLIEKEYAYLNLNIDAVPYPTINEAIAAVQDGKVDAAFPSGITNYDAEQRNLRIIDDFVYSSEMAVMRKDDNFHAENPMRAAINAENPNYISLIQEHYPNWSFVHFQTTDACLQGVAEGKADLLLISNYRLGVLDYKINELNLKAVATGTDIELTFAVSKRNPKLYSILNHMTHSCSKSQINASLARYSDVHNHVTLQDFLKDHIKSSMAVILLVFAIISFLWYKSHREHRRAQLANQAKTRFLFSMSHDIRTPMNAIIGYTKLIQENIGNTAKTADYLQKISSASRFLLGLINNVLELARIESGKVELKNVPILAEDILLDLQNLYSELFEKKGIKMTMTSELKTKAIYCDPLKINEIYLNLLSNALKYTNSGGEVKLLIKEEQSEREGFVRFIATISDTGIGMSKDYLPTIFDDFTRESTPTENSVKGTGLGMAIVKKLVDLMGGTITVDSELGKGTTFVLTIEHKIADETQLVKKEPEHKDEDNSLEGRRILLAEDNDLNAEIAIEILSAIGLVVERAENGAVCVKMLSEAPEGYYQLVLMDIQMPEMNGYEATRAIRGLKDKVKSKIPIIALTANAFEEDKKNAIKAGMNGHLAKPIEIDQLIETMKKNLK